VVLISNRWWIYGLIHHRHDHYGWLKPFLVYLGIMIRIITLYIPTSVVMNPAKFVWHNTAYRAYEMTPSRLRQPIAAVVTVAVFLIGTMVPEETGDNTRANRAVSLCGLIVMILLLTVTSRDWRLIPWHTVIGGMLSQFIVAVFVLRTKAGYDIFSFISYLARTLLSYAQDGVIFLTDSTVPDLPWFFTGVIPPIIFFVSLVQLLYHIGFIQWFIGKFAIFFFWTLRVSGAEAVVAAATPFIGQGESAMLIRPFVPHLTLSEIHQVMTCGFATIAGSVLVAYIGLGLNPQALVSSCIMSIPASLAVSKMRFPETEETLTSGKVVVPEDQEHKAANWIHAFANGAWLGIKIAGMIIATLLCIIGLVSLINGLLGWWGAYFNISDPALSLQLILGYILYPIAKLLGVANADVRRVGELIGQKIIINEFAAFNALATEDVYKSMSDRSKLIATYACCVSCLPRLSLLPVADRSPRASATSAPSAPRSASCPRSPLAVPVTSPASLCPPSSPVSWPR
jgi:CNT family concentrative nucleoside transporter